jgi:hypothetical protein
MQNMHKNAKYVPKLLGTKERMQNMHKNNRVDNKENVAFISNSITY